MRKVLDFYYRMVYDMCYCYKTTTDERLYMRITDITDIIIIFLAALLASLIAGPSAAYASELTDILVMPEEMHDVAKEAL